MAIIANLRNSPLGHELKSFQSVRMRGMARDAVSGLRVCHLPARQKQVIMTVRRAATTRPALRNILVAFETRIVTERIPSNCRLTIGPTHICHQIPSTLGQTFRPAQDPAPTVTVDTGGFLLGMEGRERARVRLRGLQVVDRFRFGMTGCTEHILILQCQRDSHAAESTDTKGNGGKNGQQADFAHWPSIQSSLARTAVKMVPDDWL